VTAPPTARIRRLARYAIRRDGAERYLFLTLVAFAATVIATRAWLELTGYPRIGGGELHIAHALFGGVFLLAAMLLPIILAGGRTYRLAAVCGGIGAGLFMDEVGKFITTRNDYFFPAAAPLIYATFLLGVLLYMHIRRRRRPDPRTLLLTSLQVMEEVVDADLQAHERDDLRVRLARVAAEASLEEQRRLATALLDFLEARELRIAPDQASALQPLRTWWRKRRDDWLGGRGLRVALVVAIFVSGVRALVDLAVALGEIRAVDPAVSAQLFTLDMAHLIVEAMVGSLLVAGSVLMALTRRDALGATLAEYGLLTSLAVADLASFYLRQFASIQVALFHAVLLIGIVGYRRRLRIAAALQRATTVP
jgi:hypothetical protein